VFSRSELNVVLQDSLFQGDLSAVRQALVSQRLDQLALLPGGAEQRLGHFVEAVLASAPDWQSDDRAPICQIAGEVCEVLAAQFGDESSKKRLRVRAALLYELAALPALTTSILVKNDLTLFLLAFFRRADAFGKLNGTDLRQMVGSSEGAFLGELAWHDDAAAYAIASQSISRTGIETLRTNATSDRAWQIAVKYGLGLSASELRAFSTTLQERIHRSTVATVEPALLPSLHRMSFPSELLPAQKAAVSDGLLDQQLCSWGFAAPTGSGKTFLARLLIADTLERLPEKKIIYLVPSRALVAEVAADLSATLKPLGYKTVSLSAQLVDLEDREQSALDDASVTVMTPEKADLLLRLGADFLDDVMLAVVDEAHHIESGTRGALLELYLWRLRRMLPEGCRYVFLSAVAPNIVDIVHWMDKQGRATTYSHRATRMRVGTYSLRGKGAKAHGMISYADGTSIEVASRPEKNVRRGICQLAQFLSAAGPVLVVAKGKKECENIARELANWLHENNALDPLSADELSSDPFKSLDACLEREMYEDVPLRKFARDRVAYHHAGLPPNARQCVEHAIRQRIVKYVVATTTLAEGVNFPFSSVIVQSLAIREPPEKGKPSRYSPVTPRTFWNIAGRAGRPGFDAEGQVILFEPSLGLDKINSVINPYVSPELSSYAPVKSALASALEEIGEDLKQENYSASELQEVKLPKQMSRRARGALNLLRVGLVHAKATGLITSPEEIVDSSFAARFLNDEAVKFAGTVLKSQEKAMEAYLKRGGALSMEKLAELGLSLETLEDLREYVSNMQSWQLANLSKLFFGGAVNLDQARFVVGPVAKRMSELEGPALGGFLSDVILHWLSGVTFSSIRAMTDFSDRLEDLIAVIYSRVQYLLPWGLWATDWLIEKETAQRHINYNNEVKNLAYLADAGVPNFNALHLTHMRIERVDATRLSRAYSRAGGDRTGVDVVGWVMNQSAEQLSRHLRGQDNRRMEHKFFERLHS